MVEGAETVDSLENVEAEPTQEASSYDHGNTPKEGAQRFSPTEDKDEGRNDDHSW